MKEIFKKQLELGLKYADIEGQPKGLLTETKNNIDTAEGQMWIKDFSWRVTEEICEAIEAKQLASNKAKEKYKKLTKDDFTALKDTDIEKLVKDTDEYYHYLEEVTDALHFMTELCIICGFNSEDMSKALVYNSREMNVVYMLGLAMNCLKNKPWKQTQMLTDRPKFKKYIQKAYAGLLGIFTTSGYTMDDIYVLYFKKCEVNKFRQRSKY